MVHGFEQSDHNFTEVMFVTYGIVASTPPLQPAAVAARLVARATPRIIRGTVHATHG
jgi:hypothetical protein